MAAEAAPGPGSGLSSASGSGSVRRWAAAHAATVSATAAAPAPPDTPVPQAPVPAVLATFTELHTWAATETHINRIAWGRHPDGRALLATAGSSDARIWDADTGRLLHVLTSHTEPIGRAEWGHARDGRLLLATGGYDGTARIWDADTGECLHTFSGYNDPPYSSGGTRNVAVAWGTGPGGFPALAAGGQNGIVRIWDPDSGQELRAIPGVEQGQADGSDIYSMAWADGPGGQARLATGNFIGRLRIWDPDTGQLLHAASIDPPVDRARATYSLAYGHRADGQLVLASAHGGEARIWTEANGEYTSQRIPAANGVIYAVSWALLADGRALLATTTNDAVHLWDGHDLRSLHTEEVSQVGTGTGRLDWTLAPDGRLLLATASERGRISIWEAVLDPPARPPAARRSPEPGRAVPRRPRPALPFPPPREVTPEFQAAARIGGTTSLACATTPDGRTLLATTSDSASVQLWDLESGHHLRTLTGHSRAVRDVAWAQAPDGRLLLATAGSQDFTARIWDSETGEELHTLNGNNRNLYGVAWGTRPDGTSLLATCNSDGTARIWNPETGRVLTTLTGHTDQVYGVAWGTGPDSTLLLASVGADCTARIWNPETGRVLTTLTGHTGQVYLADWATQRDGSTLLATCSSDGTVRIWDPSTGNELSSYTQPPGRGDGFQAVAWAQAADGRLLLTAAGTSNPTFIWDAETRAEIASLPGSGSNWRSVAWTRDRDGNLLLLVANPAPDSGPVRVWLVETAAGGEAEPQQPGPRRAGRASRQLLRLGAGGLWLPLGPLTDLVTLTAPGDAVTVPAAADAAPGDPAKTSPPRSSPDAELHDSRLAVLADEPGIGRLRGLAAGQPRWSPDARAAFAALLAAGLNIPAQYAPPDDADPAALATALAAALASTPAGARVGASGVRWQVPVAELRAATERITAQVITLLQVLGPQACAADPLLPLRLVSHAPQLPALSPRELRFLTAARARQPPGPPAALGTLAYSPGTADLARNGPITRLLPTQLALPPDLLTSRLAEDQLLYRQHRAPAPPAPQPLTLILDTTPPTYGPVGTLLRLTAHLITATLWAHGHHPYLITLDNPAVPVQLHAPADLIPLWSSVILDNPGPPLATARRTAAGLGQPALLLTHHHTARDNGYAPGPGTRLLTTHQPPEKPPPGPATPWHAHLPPAPAESQLTAAVARLLTPFAADER